MFKSFGWPEIVLILAIVLIVFGVGKLPQVGGAIGKGIRAFRKAQGGEDGEEEQPKAKAIKEAEKGSNKNEGTT